MSAYDLASPNRILNNIKRLEEAELPSLPSIQPNLDYDSGLDSSRSDVDPADYRFGDLSSDDMATPHPVKRPFNPSTSSTSPLPADMTASTSASPFPPLRPSSAETGSPYIPNRAATSTPHSLYSRSRRFVSDDTGANMTARRHTRNRSDTGEFATGNSTGREKWHTPGEMSGSFSGEEIEAASEREVPSLPAIGDLGSERSVPLQDASYTSSAGGSIDSPIAHRFSKSHVLLQRPGRRSHLAQSFVADRSSSHEASLNRATPRSPASASASPSGPTPRAPQADRVPSLSRSEMSATDASEAATTPEAPGRRVPIAYHQEAQLGEQHANNSADEQQVSEVPELPTYDYQAESSTASVNSYDDTPAPIRRVSPYRPVSARIPQSAKSFSQFSTPGLARDPAVGSRNSLHSMDFEAATPGSALRDVTHQYQATPLPFTPSPTGMMSKNSDFSTPRAPLDDNERRKNHVLAVLSSSGLPAREKRVVRGTPHPLRRFSSSPHSDSIQEEGTPVRQDQSSMLNARSPLTSILDRSASAPPNESFVSVASSADLTTDRRGTAQPRFSRANTSFPTMLLPTSKANTSGAGSLRGLGPGDHRADGVKIHKHLNAMNKQLLETNADLAREAEAWRDEASRLMGLLSEAGVEVEQVDVLANIARSRDVSLADARSPGESGVASRSGDISAGNASENAAIVQELAEKLEGLEDILNEKDAQIVELEDEVTALRQNAPTSESEAEQRIVEMEEQLDEAEQARQALHADFSAKTEQHAKRFGEICSGFEEQVAGLEAELAGAKKEVERLRSDKERLERLAESVSAGAREMELGRQVQTLGVDLDRARTEIQARTAELEALQAAAETSEADRQQRQGEADAVQQQIADLEAQLHSANAGAMEAAAEIEQLHAELADLKHSDQTRRTEEVDRLNEDIDSLHALVEGKETEIEALLGKLEVAELAAQPLRQSIRDGTVSPAKSRTKASFSGGEQASFVAALEDRLDEAYREIGRLKHELSSTPHRKSTMEAKDAKIRALEQEKAALTARVSPARTPVPASQAGLPMAGTPFGKAGPTPFMHRTIAALRVPRTPGSTPGSLKELSWLNTTMGHADESNFRAQIDELQDELNNVNQQLDDNFSRLEAAGMGGIELAEKLALAHQRISALEDEIRALLQRNKASLALVHAQREENNQESEERFQAALGDVRSQLAALKVDTDTERKRLRADNDRLRTAKTAVDEQLETEISAMRNEVNEAIDAANGEVEQAKRDAIAASLEAASLRRELQTARDDIGQLEKRISTLQDSIKTNDRRHARELAGRADQAELADRAAQVDCLRATQRDAEHRANRLSAQLQEKEAALEQAETRVSDMRAERETIIADVEEFERDLVTQTNNAQRLAEQLQELQEQQHTQNAEKGRYADLERKYRATTDQLDKVRAESRDTDALRAQMDKLEKEYRGVKQEMRAVERDLRRVGEEREALESWKSTHVCESGTGQALIDQKTRFKAQTRDLATQIQYLKAKYTREATFRNGLALQKRYLLLLVGGMSLNEQATLKALVTLGYPEPAAPKKVVSLKAVGLAVIGLIRARKSAAAWRAEKELKAGAVANLGERRRASGR